MQPDTQPGITLRFTPWESRAAYQRLKRTAEIMRDTATDRDLWLEYQLWVDNADRNLDRINRLIEREHVS